MLHHSNPTVPLRLSAQRTVLNCVWAEQLDLSNVPETGPLLDYLRAQSTADAGDVKSHMHLDSSLHTPLETLCRLVAKKLKAWHLLADNANLVSTALLMSTRGAQPHHDADVTPEGNKLFWSLSLQDTDTDVVFANIGQRLPQSQGTLVVFDHSWSSTTRGLRPMPAPRRHGTRTKILHEKPFQEITFAILRWW